MQRLTQAYRKPAMDLDGLLDRLAGTVAQFAHLVRATLSR